jgi:hypothetical protein
VVRLRSGGFQDQACLGLFVWLFGALWASGACSSCAGVPWASAVFPWPVPDPGVHLFCSLRIRLESLTGGSCLSSPWWAAGSVQYPASLSQIHQVRGILQVRFPYQGRYPPATRPDMLEDDGDDNDIDRVKDGKCSDRCSSGSGAVWVLCLASGSLSGIIWFPFERRVSSGTPLGSLWPLLGAWAPPAPVWGLRAASAFSHS